MSIHQTFPDVIVQPDGSLRLVTMWVKDWLWAETQDTNGIGPDEDMPDVIEIDGDLGDLLFNLDDVGFVVKDKRPKRT